MFVNYNDCAHGKRMNKINITDLFLIIKKR